MTERDATLPTPLPGSGAAAAWHPERILFGRHRRRQADAIRHWFAAAPIGALPPAAMAPPQLGALTGVREIAALAEDPSRSEAARLWAALAPQMETIAASPTPLRIQAELPVDGAWVTYDGLILPFRAEDGALMLALLGETRLLALEDDGAMDASAAASTALLASADRIASASPWDRAAMPAQVDPTPSDPAPLSDPWEQARLWAVLAASAPVARATSLHAALGASLALRRKTDDQPLDAIVDRIFGPLFDAAARSRFAAVLDRADRLGIEPGAFGRLLDRAGGAEPLLHLLDLGDRAPHRQECITLTRVDHAPAARRAEPVRIEAADRIAA